MAVDNSINSDDLRFWINNTISYGENPIQKFAQEQELTKIGRLLWAHWRTNYSFLVWKLSPN